MNTPKVSYNFIKKLKASTPDLLNKEASDKYTLALDSIVNGEEKYTVYHSSMMGLEPCAERISELISNTTIIAKNETEFIYSYHPYAILYFEIPIDDINKVMPVQNEALLNSNINVWAMMYSNCIITYSEVDQYKDLWAIVLPKEGTDE